MVFYWGDQTFILVLIGMALSMLASAYVQSTFNKYSSIDNQEGLTGDDVARKILSGAAIREVSVR